MSTTTFFMITFHFVGGDTVRIYDNGRRYKTRGEVTQMIRNSIKHGMFVNAGDKFVNLKQVTYIDIVGQDLDIEDAEIDEFYSEVDTEEIDDALGNASDNV